MVARSHSLWSPLAYFGRREVLAFGHVCGGKAGCRSCACNRSGYTDHSERIGRVLPFVDMSEKKDQEYFSDG